MQGGVRRHMRGVCDWCGKGSKRKQVFIKDNITGNINTVRGYIETLVTFMHGTVAKKHTFFWSGTQVCGYYMDVDEFNTHRNTLRKVKSGASLHRSSTGVFMLRRREGILLIIKQAAVKASLQKRNGTNA
jgi:hypothetical protein